MKAPPFLPGVPRGQTEAPFAELGTTSHVQLVLPPCLSCFPHALANFFQEHFISHLRQSYQFKVCFWGTLPKRAKQGRGLLRVEMSCEEGRERQWEAFLGERP